MNNNNNISDDFIRLFETDNFRVITLKKPHIDRNDGGHIIIVAKSQEYKDRTELSADMAIEMMGLSMIVGKAMKSALILNGVDIVNINYQENGNWSIAHQEKSTIHLHLYGRANSSVHQKFGEALVLPMPSAGYYDNFKSLTSGDISKINDIALKLNNSDKYKKFMLRIHFY